MKRFFALLLAFLLAFSLAACGDTSSPAPAPLAPDTTGAEQQPEQAEPEPEPYVPAEPIIFTGTGDDVLELDELDYLYCFKISGNADARHFAVKTYDAEGNYSELLVNTTEPYSGITFDESCAVSVIEVKASGAWTIEVADLITIDQVAAGETYSGSGDMLFWIPDHGKTATITGNAGAHHFAVKSYDNYVYYDDLLVNTTEPYDGKVMLGSDALMIAVTAQGDWTFTPN